jgi:hypothetical protein
MDMHTAFGSLDLKYLMISNAKLLDRTTILLMEGLKISNPDLKELDLSQNKIGDRS